MSSSEELFNLKKELLEKELEELQNGNKELAKELSELSQKRKDLLEKNIKICKENSVLESEIVGLQKMNIEIEQLLELFENSEKYQKDLKTKSESLQETLSNFTSFCKEENKDLPPYKQVEEYKTECKNWADKLADVEDKIAEGEKINKEEIEKKEAEIQEMMNKIKKCVQRKVENENEIMELTGYCEDMKKEVETKTKEILELQNYKADLQSRITALTIEPSKQNSEQKEEI